LGIGKAVDDEHEPDLGPPFGKQMRNPLAWLVGNYTV